MQADRHIGWNNVMKSICSKRKFSSIPIPVRADKIMILKTTKKFLCRQVVFSKFYISISEIEVYFIKKKILCSRAYPNGIRKIPMDYITRHNMSVIEYKGLKNMLFFLRFCLVAKKYGISSGISHIPCVSTSATYLTMGVPNKTFLYF